MPPTGPQLVHAIKRNFGGLKEEDLDPEKVFWDLLPKDVDRPPDLERIQPDVSHSLFWYSAYLLGCICYLALSDASFCESRQQSTWTNQD